MNKIAAVALTYVRPVELGRTIECFLKQTYQNRELVILDDAGQFPDCPSGDRWRVISVPDRYPNLGTKRNAAVKLVSPDVDFIQTWDDDDVHLPWTLEACVEALTRGVWAQPRQALEWDGKAYRRFETYHRKHPGQFAYHGNWCYRLPEFWTVGGYPPIMDDDAIWKRMTAAYGPSVDTISVKHPTPGYAYSRVPTDHLSWHYKSIGMEGAWASMNAGKVAPATIPVGWDIDYAAIPIPEIAEPRSW